MTDTTGPGTPAKKDHSNLGPSSAERWTACPGSVALSAGIKGTTSMAAAEGNVAHHIAELLVTGRKTAPGLAAMIGEFIEQEGYEIEVTDEMVDGAIEYERIMWEERKAMQESAEHPLDVKVDCEIRVSAAKSIDPAVYGTADYRIYAKGHRLVVVDYKYGKGKAVAAEDNLQLAIYGIATMDSLDCWDFPEIKLMIFQPRNGGLKEWVTTPIELRAVADKTKAAAILTRQPNAPVIAGEHCRWCPAKARCPLMFDKAQEAARVDFMDKPVLPVKSHLAQLPDVRLMPREKQVAALAWEDHINEWFEALRLDVRAALEAGEEVPGMKLVHGRANRAWIDEADVVAKFEPVLGEDLFEHKILSPSKIEKKLGKKAAASYGLDALTMKPEPPKVIAFESDPRPAVPRSVMTDFTALSAPDDLLGNL